MVEKMKYCNLDLCAGLLVSGHSLETESLVEFGLALGAQNSAAPVLSDLVGSLVVVGLYGLDELGELLLVLVLDVSKRDTGALFSANELSKSGLAFDNAVWNIHLSAESWQVHNNLDWVDIVSDDDELSLLSLDQVNDLVDAAGEGGWSLAWGVWLAVGSCLGPGHQSSLLLGLVLWRVFSGELEKLGGGLLVQGLGELVDAWGHLESLLENGALSLELDVFWPSNESGEVSFWLDVLADAKVLGSLLEERVGGALLLTAEFLDWGRGHSLTFSHHFLRLFLVQVGFL